MEIRNTIHALETAAISTTTGIAHVADLQWKPHPVFPGVMMKTLLSSEKTGGDLSCHLVKVAPESCLETHIHEQQQELHHVVAGSADAEVDGRHVRYTPGNLSVIATGTPHRVLAGTDGLLLLAIFTPAAV
ncbi:cupin domain-containing protein [Desulfovibrio inopinatus]|uniref:cupin domain-containing protein n=1 Tax=Desulfovibrio inopinatus TaxID=102109 RepID=UPI00040FDABA|nr:cupin domain-containing protein [Desulfovibrio inopinatus]